MNELKPEDVMRALEYCTSGGSCLRCVYDKGKHFSKEGAMACYMRDALALLREKDAEIEMLKEMIDTSSEVVDYAVDKIREARASMLDEARRLSFEAGDQQYLSIAELEKIAKGNAE